MKKILITAVFLMIFLLSIVSVNAVEDRLCKTIEEGEVIMAKSPKGVDFEIESALIETAANQATFVINGIVFTLKENGKTTLSEGSEVTVSKVYTENSIDKVDFCLNNFGTGEFIAVPEESEKELRELPPSKPPTAGDSKATPEACGVPSEFRDKTDNALVAFWSPVELPKWAHGKKYGKLYLEGGYWLTLKEIKDKTATIDIDGQTATVKEGENKEINGVKVYLYQVGNDYIDYCIHETATQALQFTCTQGCITDSKCLPFGARLIVDEKPSYCDLDKKLGTQKGVDAACQNNYECASNFCGDNKCVAIAEKLGLLDRIASFLKRIFGFKG